MTRYRPQPIERQHGAFDWRDLHRPTDPEVIAQAIRRLNHQGLKPRDIAISLRVDLGMVLAALKVPA